MDAAGVAQEPHHHHYPAPPEQTDHQDGEQAILEIELDDDPAARWLPGHPEERPMSPAPGQDHSDPLSPAVQPADESAGEPVNADGRQTKQFARLVANVAGSVSSTDLARLSGRFDPDRAVLLQTWDKYRKGQGRDRGFPLPGTIMGFSDGLGFADDMAVLLALAEDVGLRVRPNESALARELSQMAYVLDRYPRIRAALNRQVNEIAAALLDAERSQPPAGR